MLDNWQKINVFIQIWKNSLYENKWGLLKINGIHGNSPKSPQKDEK